MTYMKFFGITLLLTLTTQTLATVEIITAQQAQHWKFTLLAKEVRQRTSLELATTMQVRNSNNFHTVPWLWVRNLAFVDDNIAIAQWLKKGGMLIAETASAATLTAFTARTFGVDVGSWQNIPLDHELMRSFYLLNTLPVCNTQRWRGFTFAGRLVIVIIPHRLLAYLRDQGDHVPCLAATGREMATRIFINLLMVALAGDYKKDQVHLPEILKRLR